MNLTRLMALGTLARYGPQHGHQIRRLADLTNVGEWGGVSVGALYRELRTMERDGRLELVTLRDRAIRPTETGPDPLGVALTFAVDDMDREELREALRNRRNRLAIGAAELTAERERLVAKGHIGLLTAANMRRGVLHMETEVGWLDELDAELAATEDDT